jgi:hypothetical protein
LTLTLDTFSDHEEAIKIRAISFDTNVVNRNNKIGRPRVKPCASPVNMADVDENFSDMMTKANRSDVIV